MPLVLVTGISGYVASYVAKELFERGYTVRGTVRNVKKADGVKKLFVGKDLTLVEVADIAESDLSEAVKGVDAIMHVASPYHFQINDPWKDMLQPAIKGTTNVLHFAHKAGVKQVVITSSFAAVTNLIAGGPWRDYTYTEKDWNPATVEDACEAGRPGPFVYSASKKLAEEAAWEFQEEHPEMAITTLCPPMIYGPPIQATNSAEELNTSSATLYALINNLKQLPDDRLPFFCAVQDVAKAHVLSLKQEGVKNKRVIICADEAFTWRQAVEYLQEQRPELTARLPPVPETPTPQRQLAKLDTSRAKSELKMDFIPWRTMLLDTIDSLVELEKQWKA